MAAQYKLLRQKSNKYKLKSPPLSGGGLLLTVIYDNDII